MSEPRAQWPIDWQPVVGDRGGVLAWIEARLALFALWTLGAMPIGVQDFAASTLARAMRRFDRRHSNAAREFLNQAYGAKLPRAERERLIFESWSFFFRMIARSDGLDRVVKRDGYAAHFEMHYGPGVREALFSGRGRMLVTPHLGDFEAGALTIPLLGLGPCYVVSRPPRNRYLSIAFQRQRDARGYRLLHRRGAMDEVSKIFQARGTLVLMLDQRARRRPTVAPFFGRLAHCERAPAILMRRLKVPVITVWCEALPEAWKYRMHFTRVFEPQDFARATPEEISTALNGAMEEMILSAPEQYFWFHKRYYKAPVTDPSSPTRRAEELDPD